MKTTFALVMLAALFTFGCQHKTPMYSASGEKLVMVQKNVELHRKSPNIWPARGWVAATEDELIFVPQPQYWPVPVYVHGRDSTFVRLKEIDRFEKKNRLLILPMGLDVVTKDGTRYPFVTARREKLINQLTQLTSQ
ncbi:hypothetical protein FVR03_00040 [Pontibacter qinzhouensis]|uniref:Lipoprotein n=1 Tax=Pontibacter qinzhouensis TaxID=2603253 RepID=A0A5C8KBC4_9BACT|nr:hypothetical protein [Pontibacter qinzhouensis]TXK52801.1 hypothetical protein FVR03_00040 [Pontibacter qinzhouensis]